jgi:D-glycero-D-manno-heptose 1,7-bisphosphate phosphatase
MKASAGAEPRAVLFDRDGTLVVDVPYNSDPALVVVMPMAAAALHLLRAAHIAVGVVTNQSGIGLGLISQEDVARVNGRIEEILGPFDTWCVCPHRPDDGCSCRKPLPGLVLEAARALGVAPGEVAVIGDIGSDVEAAEAAGAQSVLVPTQFTQLGEVIRAPVLAPDLLSAVQLLLARRRAPQLSANEGRNQ